MMRSFLSRSLFASFVLGSIALPQAACLSLPDETQKPVLGTHVDDWRDEVIYQVLIDRFADADVNNDYTVQPGQLGRYQGGDWRGLMQHLDYLQNLGVTTVWISPVVRNIETDANVDGYHGYWSQDLSQLNPHFGDMGDLRELTAQAHKLGMKVVLDIVVNHMGQVFFYDMNLNGVPDEDVSGTGTTSPVTHQNEYAPDWNPAGVQAFSSAGISGRAPIIFVEDPAINRVTPGPGILGTAGAYHGFGQILDYSVVAQRTLGDFPGGLKDVATELPEVRATMVDAYSNWVEQADLDGFRIDTVKHVEHGFWQTFAPAVRARLAAEGKNRFMMFGESFDGDDQLIGSYTAPTELDSVVYFSQHYTVFQQVFEFAHDSTQQKGTDQIEQLWSQQTVNYNTQPQAQGSGLAASKSLINFIDNHDVARFLFDSNGDIAALRNALTLLFTEEGVPCLYYGTEQDFSGGNDPANREVLWDTGFNTTGDTFRHIAKLTQLRKTYDALRRGDTTVRWSTPDIGTEDDAGMFAYERSGGDAQAESYALVVLNTNDNKSSSTSNGGTNMKVGVAPGTVLVDVLDPSAVQVTVAADGTLPVTVDAQSARIFIPQTQVQQ